MTIQANFPAIRPSLLLDFANSKRLDPRVALTRASTARYYDGVTVAKAEENLLVRSQEFGDGYWNKLAVAVTVNNTTAPDGTSTADEMLGDGTSAVHAVYAATGTLVSANSYAISVFVKPSGNNYFQIFTNTGTSKANFNITAGAGAVGTVDGVFSGGAITDFGNGWYRCSAIISGSTSIQIYFGLITSTTSARAESFTTSSGVYLWGAQLEQRSAVTAYTPTTTAPITNYIPALQTAQAGVPRFDHNPTTGESLGLLIEEARTNTALRSEEFGTTWTATRATVVANQVVAPDGTLTADQIVDTTDNNTHFISQTFTGTAALWTFSVYAKASGLNHVALRLFNGTSQVGLAYYNLSTGATGTVTAGTATIASVGNGWYRCALTATLAASASCTADIQLANADNTNSFVGNAWNGVTVWGAQVELGAFLTSYIPTGAATATRQADAATMTGTNFSSWYNASEGTFFYEAAKIQSGNVFQSVLTVRNSAAALTERNPDVGIGTGWGGAAGIFRVSYRTGNVEQAALGDQLSFSAFTFYRGATAYRVNDFASATSGGALNTDTSGQVSSTVNMLDIGQRTDGTNVLCGTIRKIAYYPARLTNAQLQAITG